MEELTRGEIYLINHSRKGIFNLEFLYENDNFITGTIVSGRAKFFSGDAGEGEEITLRKSLCITIKPIRCDCQDYDKGLVSELCPVHNQFPLQED